MLVLENVTKKYGEYAALKNVRLTFRLGVYGVLGPNGAGKSTMMKLLTLSEKVTEGSILYNNCEIWKLGKSFLEYIGYVPQQQALYGGFTAEDFLNYVARLKGIEKNESQTQIEQLLTFVNLEKDRNKKIKGFSGGMKQRLLLAQSLLGNPEIILLDEPTAAVDPMERVVIRNLIKKIGENKIVLITTHILQSLLGNPEIILLDEPTAAVDPMERVVIRNLIKKIGENKIVLITTHILSDIETIANNIVLLNKGKVVFDGTREDVLAKYGKNNLEEVYVEVFGVEECIDYS